MENRFALLPLLLFFLAGRSSGSNCNPQETQEAENAFKNCVESAQATIVGQGSKQEDQDKLCGALENMLSGKELFMIAAET